jgi:hypothetical protein
MFDDPIAWNRYVVDDTNSSNLAPGGTAVFTETILVPTGATQARINGRLVFSQIGGAAGGIHTGQIELSAVGGGGPWAPLLGGSVNLPNCSAIRCDRTGSPIVFGAQTFDVTPGQRIRMTYTSPQGVFIWYGDDPLVTFIDIEWSRPGDSWFPL